MLIVPEPVFPNYCPDRDRCGSNHDRSEEKSGRLAKIVKEQEL